jgi:hypothetical protein
MALIGLAVHRASIGRLDLAVQNTLINLVANLYSIMHRRADANPNRGVGGSTSERGNRN